MLGQGRGLPSGGGGGVCLYEGQGGTRTLLCPSGLVKRRGGGDSSLLAQLMFKLPDEGFSEGDCHTI